MVETKRKPLDLQDESRTYLTDIFNGEWRIHNPTALDISGLKRITATSMVLQRWHDDQIESYFTFKQKEGSGEIIRREGQYYILLSNI